MRYTHTRDNNNVAETCRPILYSVLLSEHTKVKLMQGGTSMSSQETNVVKRTDTLKFNTRLSLLCKI